MKKKENTPKKQLQKSSGTTYNYMSNREAEYRRKEYVRKLRSGLIPEEETLEYCFGIPDIAVGFSSDWTKQRK